MTPFIYFTLAAALIMSTGAEVQPYLRRKLTLNRESLLKSINELYKEAVKLEMQEDAVSNEGPPSDTDGNSKETSSQVEIEKIVGAYEQEKYEEALGLMKEAVFGKEVGCEKAILLTKIFSEDKVEKLQQACEFNDLSVLEAELLKLEASFDDHVDEYKAITGGREIIHGSFTFFDEVARQIDSLIFAVRDGYFHMPPQTVLGDSMTLPYEPTENEPEAGEPMEKGPEESEDSF